MVSASLPPRGVASSAIGPGLGSMLGPFAWDRVTDRVRWRQASSDSATRENRARPLRPARRGCLGGAAILVLLAAASARPERCAAPGRDLACRRQGERFGPDHVGGPRAGASLASGRSASSCAGRATAAWPSICTATTSRRRRRPAWTASCPSSLAPRDASRSKRTMRKDAIGPSSTSRSIPRELACAPCGRRRSRPVACERSCLRRALRPAAAALALPRSAPARRSLCPSSSPPCSSAAASALLPTLRLALPARAASLAESALRLALHRRLRSAARGGLSRRAGRLGQQPPAGHRLGDLVGRRHLRQRADRRRLAPDRSLARRCEAVSGRPERHCAGPNAPAPGLRFPSSSSSPGPSWPGPRTPCRASSPR